VIARTKERETADDHHIREHPYAGKKYGGRDMEPQHKNISYRPCFTVDEKERDKQIVKRAKPAKQIGNPLSRQPMANGFLQAAIFSWAGHAASNRGLVLQYRQKSKLYQFAA
jgi:hypothetical protein